MGPYKCRAGFDTRTEAKAKTQAIHSSSLAVRTCFSNKHVNCTRTRQRFGIWRPWQEESGHNIAREAGFEKKQNHGVSDIPRQTSGNIYQTFKHPVRLCWPKRPYDYLYQDGLLLLKNFPIQATLEFVSEPDSESENDENE